MIEPVAENLRLLMSLFNQKFHQFVEWNEKDAVIDSKYLTVKNVSITTCFAGFETDVRITLTELMMITKDTKENQLSFEYNKDSHFLEVSFKDIGVQTLEGV